jgi:hypothetical protein
LQGVTDSKGADKCGVWCVKGQKQTKFLQTAARCGLKIFVFGAIIKKERKGRSVLHDGGGKE